MSAVASSLTASEKQLIESNLRKFQIISTAVARLYLAYPDRNNWTYKSLGAITVVYDNANSYYLKLLDIQRNGEVLWECPITKQLKYNDECNYFHSFYTDYSAAGLSFADENEAKNFSKCVILHMNQSQIPVNTKRISLLSGPSTITPSPESNKDSKKKNKNKKKDSKNKDKKHSSKSKDKKKNSKKIDKSMISDPKDFKHTLHMGAECFGTFSESDNVVIEDALKILSSQRNITKDQLNGNDYKFIAKFLNTYENAKPATAAPIQSITIQSQPPQPPQQSQLQVKQQKVSRGAPPPPPPSSRQKVAPPPPPSRQKVAPPPPPSRSKAAPPPPPQSRSSAKPVPPPPSRAAPPIPNRMTQPSSSSCDAPPPLPARAAIPQPSNSTPPSSLPLSNSSTSVPPPPSGGPPPPPPPPPGPITPYRTEDSENPPKSRPVSDNDGRNDLLASIRNAGIASLKPASQRQVKQIEAPALSSSKNDLASALAMALLKRKDDMNDEGIILIK